MLVVPQWLAYVSRTMVNSVLLSAGNIIIVATSLPLNLVHDNNEMPPGHLTRPVELLWALLLLLVLS